jgi:transcriptional regulator with XRE-family HTH domain
VTSTETLGAYLRARRAQVTPEQAGLHSAGQRRVPGLRREEVAALADLSADYYTRLEQGRERHPSPGVLQALARALRLGPDAQRYLFALASGPGARTPRPGRAALAGENLLVLMDEWPHHPSILLDHCNNVVAANQLGRALIAGHQHSDNLTRLVFLDPDAAVFYRDRPKVAAATVAAMRAAASHDPGDPELLALVGELTVRSREFCRLWAKAEVREKTSGELLVRHPVVGDLDLIFESLRPNTAPGLLLKVYRAAPHSVATRESLSMLGSLTAEGQADQVSMR